MNTERHGRRCSGPRILAFLEGTRATRGEILSEDGTCEPGVNASEMADRDSDRAAAANNPVHPSFEYDLFGNRRITLVVRRIL